MVVFPRGNGVHGNGVVRNESCRMKEFFQGKWRFGWSNRLRGEWMLFLCFYTVGKKREIMKCRVNGKFDLLLVDLGSDRAAIGDERLVGERGSK